MRQLQDESDIWEALRLTKNLLAFSGGVDSSALFYMLLQKEIPFDIAIVNYNTRGGSKDEEEFARQLAKKHGKLVFIKSVKLDSANFEANARAVRYEFFDEIIKQNGYETLLSAHHLGDKLEWFFMRLIRGAGAVELCGFSQIEQREGYAVARPLIWHTKEELLEFLTKNGYEYFVDESNFDEKYERNRFRKNFSEPLLKEYKEGIRRSLKALEEDKEKLLPREYQKIDSLYIFKRGENELRLIAKILKFFKIVLSKKQRDEIERLTECVISGKVAIGKNAHLIFIAPFVKDEAMDKAFKETCRKSKIPPNVRAYMYKEGIEIEKVCKE
ncbi:MAG: tRNA lysidine(34) synthetase TilS [Campylobacteraceae bacterium]|nr:tRNA lysidine(34) synthetase TilS [Campylobacteraceae bacterium]